MAPNLIQSTQSLHLNIVSNTSSPVQNVANKTGYQLLKEMPKPSRESFQNLKGTKGTHTYESQNTEIVKCTFYQELLQVDQVDNEGHSYPYSSLSLEHKPSQNLMLGINLQQINHELIPRSNMLVYIIILCASHSGSVAEGWFERSPRKRKFRCSNPSRDRPNCKNRQLKLHCLTLKCGICRAQVKI